MTAYLNHPVLREMLSSRCSSEADTGRSFHLYMTLCEQYRVPKVEWHCDQGLGIIYMVTGEAVTPLSELEADRRKHLSSPILTAASGDGVKQEETAPQADTNHIVDAPEEIIVAKENLVLLPSSSATAPSVVSGSEQVTDTAAKPLSCDSQDRLDAETPTVFISFSFEAIIKHSFLVAVDNLRKKFPGARLSIVPSSHWSLLGNYIVNCDVQAEVYHSSRPAALRPTKTEDAVPGEAAVTGSETTDAEQDSSCALGSLHPGCFPEAYIVSAQQPLVDEDITTARPVCFPEAYIINARQQQEQLQQNNKGDAKLPGPACYPDSHTDAQTQHQSAVGGGSADRLNQDPTQHQSAVGGGSADRLNQDPTQHQSAVGGESADRLNQDPTQHQSAVGGGSADRLDQDPEAQHQGGAATNPELVTTASVKAKSGRSTPAQLGWDPVDWAGSQAPTESWD